MNRKRTCIAVAASVIYLASVILANWLTTQFGFIDVGFGNAATAGTFAAGGIDTPHQQNLRPAGVTWCADNGCFSARFQEEHWWSFLEKNAKDAGRCSFATAPDVVGDAAATLERSAPWLQPIRDLGYPVALVGQDGLEDLTVPWDDFDAFFIGGSTDWKLSEAAADLVAEARERGKWVHMGRVNSKKRLQYADGIGCNSADGTLAELCHWRQNRRRRPKRLPLALRLPLRIRLPLRGDGRVPRRPARPARPRRRMARRHQHRAEAERVDPGQPQRPAREPVRARQRRTGSRPGSATPCATRRCRQLKYAHVELHYRPKTNAHRDPDNLVATLKPAIDALHQVDERSLWDGILVDDDPRYLSWSPPMIHRAVRGQAPALWLLLRTASVV
jgi:hypothetical protein